MKERVIMHKIIQNKFNRLNPFLTVVEPFRIKVVEPIHSTTRDQRLKILEKAHFNPFFIRSDDVLIDLLTDSGTSAMSTEQWAGMMRGDESYAGGRSYYRFLDVVKRITGYSEILPTHQGRAAERILFSTLVKSGDVVPNNAHFDTTRANIEAQGALAVDLPFADGKINSTEHPFKGDIDLPALQALLSKNPGKVPLVMITVTNNTRGGQPVSLENLRATSHLCKKYEVPLFLDAARFAENAELIRQRETGQSHRQARDIALDMFSLTDGCTMSAKKDGLVNMGGFLGVNNADLARKCANLLILSEGYVTYGGLAGYDLEALATGLEEVLDPDYLSYRIRSIAYLGNRLTEANIPILRPPGGHAIYLDAKEFLPHIPSHEYPAWTLSLAIYLEGGIRTVEIGSVMLGKQPDGTEVPSECELVRLAFPRRVYTQSHVDYVCEVISHVHALRSKIRGVQFTASEKVLRHFTAHFRPVHGALIAE